MRARQDFKIPTLSAIVDLFQPLDASSPSQNDKEKEKGKEKKEPKVKPFIAGFGNRVTDAISYRAVHINDESIFIVDRFGKEGSSANNSLIDLNKAGEIKTPGHGDESEPGMPGNDPIGYAPVGIHTKVSGDGSIPKEKEKEKESKRGSKRKERRKEKEKEKMKRKEEKKEEVEKGFELVQFHPNYKYLLENARKLFPPNL